MFEVPMVEVGMGTLLEPSIGRQVLEEEISANTSRSSTTTSSEWSERVLTRTGNMLSMCSNICLGIWTEKVAKIQTKSGNF